MGVPSPTGRAEDHGMAAAATARADVLGCTIDRIGMKETLARIEDMIATGSCGQHVAINTAKLVGLRGDVRLRQFVQRCDLVNADGQGVIWASRLLGDPLPERVAGIDLMDELLALAERKGYRVYILGARDEVLERAVGRIRARYPDLELAGWRDGYFSRQEEAEVCAAIRASRPHIVFVAMSTPRKEYFLGERGPELGAGFAMGVGGAVDVIAGRTRRAPVTWQRLGLEWLFRLLQEPRRMLRRYAVTNTRFAWMIAVALVGARLRR
jgi:N-acetylglucosaminyldiphosphoundecaprenol N-acetyl-beta-D-mannosaminyltransferase